MPIQSGTHVGPYEILSAVGAGGMGEVYRARDPKLGRDVAIKVLPEAFARDAERMARFQREAKVLASLSHPNIATIYGLEDSGSTRALVMELVEGPTLADRIKAGPIPVDESVRIAKQIADALEYAHERGIIHRDLKPANVKVSVDDTVKVLDFGLAKALESDIASIDISTSPTISRMATQAGVLLGTAAYMSPEQAKAKTVDRRADIWAFGCVLYEMLTGKVAFPGESVTDTLAGVIRAEPDWSLLPTSTPMRVRVLLQRCLQKDPKQRLRDIGDARISLDEVLSGAPEPTSTSPAPVSTSWWQPGLPWLLFGLTAAALALVYFRERPPTSVPPVRFEISLPEKVVLSPSGVFALSPDGHQLAFFAAGTDGVQHLWVRPLDSFEARPLVGTESATASPFFWSPDSRYVVFDAGGKLKKIDISGGAIETLCDLSGFAVGGSWNSDGVIIFGTTQRGVMRVSAAGGAATPLTALDPSRKESLNDFPSFLPDGRHFIYRRLSTAPENTGIYVGSLDAEPGEQDSKKLLSTEFAATYVPSSQHDSGLILFIRDRALLAQPFDARRLELTGEPVALAEGVGTTLGYGFFSSSSNGILAYRTGSSGGAYRLTWFDRQGKALGTTGTPAALFASDSISPDGTRALFGRIDLQSANVDLWLLDFSRDTSTRFTFGPSTSLNGVWSPDRNRIAFASKRSGVYDIYQKLTNGTSEEELLLKSNEDKFPSSWSRDGRFLLYTAIDPKTKGDLWVFPLDGNKKPFPLVQTEFNEQDGRFSPDGHLIAYTSDDSGRDEIYVRTFSAGSTTVTDTGTKWLISNAGGEAPRWRGDGKELYYHSPDGRIMAVEITANAVFRASTPTVLFQALPQLNLSGFQWDVTSDGNRFLFPAQDSQVTQAPFMVVLNWQAGLKK
jgi:eukaryotic-like serine/threonine-protein kinase